MAGRIVGRRKGNSSQLRLGSKAAYREVELPAARDLGVTAISGMGSPCRASVAILCPSANMSCETLTMSLLSKITK